GPTKNAVDISRGLPKGIGGNVSVRDETPILGKKTERVDGREAVSRRQRDDRVAMYQHEGAWQHNQTTARLPCERSDGGFDLGRVVNRRSDSFHADRRSRGFEGLEKALRIRRGARGEQ